MFKKVENPQFFLIISNLLNYLFSEIAWNINCLVRFEKTPKNVKAVNAPYYMCITSTTTTTGYVPVKLQQKDCYPKIGWKSGM